jgi:hypothetical protein
MGLEKHTFIRDVPQTPQLSEVVQSRITDRGSYKFYENENPIYTSPLCKVLSLSYDNNFFPVSLNEERRKLAGTFLVFTEPHPNFPNSLEKF